MDGARSDTLFLTQRHGGTEKGHWVLGESLRELCSSVFPRVRAMDGARSDARFLTQRHGGTEKGHWVLRERLRELCDSVFPKSAQWMARGLMLFF
jgi:hypothetical protein